MLDAKLVLNGQEFPLYYKVVNSIAENLPNVENYKSLAKALLALDIPSITESLINSGHLEAEEMDAVWEKGNLDLRRKLADTRAFLKNLTDAQAREIMDLNDSEMLRDVAADAEMLYPDEDDVTRARRLSGQMADALMEFMTNHPDSQVRGALWDNTSTPAKFKPSFAEIIKTRNLGWGIDLSGIKMEDFEAVRDTSIANLKAIANNVEDIKDKGLRAKVCELLCQHPDPAVRLELAENYSAPKSALRKLIHDPDKDVARTAAERLDDED